MTNFRFFDETFDINQSNSYNLSIQISLDGFSFCIYDTIAQKYISLAYYQAPSDFEIINIESFYKEICKTESWLSADFKKVNCIYISQKNTLIPEEIFNKEQLKKYLEFNHYIGEFEEINFNKVESIDSYNVYSIPSDLTYFICKTFKSVRYLNQASLFIHDCIHESVNKFGNSVYLNINEHFIDIAVINKSKLILYNTIERRDDITDLYFILNVFDKLKLSPLSTETHLSGYISEDSGFYKLMTTYLAKTKFRKFNASQIFSYHFDMIPQHQFMNLINSTNADH